MTFDSDWRFLKADATGAEQPKFKDSAWRKLNLPHDWSIEGPFAETNLTGGAGAFMPSGIAWYRKHFSLPAALTSDDVSIQFDGVMQRKVAMFGSMAFSSLPSSRRLHQLQLRPHRALEFRR